LDSYNRKWALTKKNKKLDGWFDLIDIREELNVL